MSNIDVSFTLNGQSVTDHVAANTSLLDYLHDRHQARGAKLGCSRGVCGACTVLIDGTPVASCSVFAFQLDGRALTTIEGIGIGTPDPVQQAFAEHSAFQCGYCTPGMILLVKAMLARHDNPDRATITEWLSSNVCRCTGYMQIVAAVEDVIRRARKEAA